MRRLWAPVLVLSVAGGCAATIARSPVAPSEPGNAEERAGTPLDFTIVWSATAEVDHGDGVHRGTTVARIVVTPHARRFEEERDGKAAPSRPDEPLPAQRRDAIAALLDRLPTAPGPFRLSRFVDDEGSHRETIEVRRPASVIRHVLEQGPSLPAAPAALARLYELVVDRRLPSETEP